MIHRERGRYGVGLSLDMVLYNTEEEFLSQITISNVVVHQINFGIIGIKLIITSNCIDGLGGGGR